MMTRKSYLAKLIFCYFAQIWRDMQTNRLTCVPSCTKHYINRKHHSFGVISNILGRDLGHLKKLELVSKYNSPVHLEEARHLVMEKLSILTTLNKLKSLTIDFALEVDLLEDLAQILKKCLGLKN
jgi:hypothetical protein